MYMYMWTSVAWVLASYLVAERSSKVKLMSCYVTAVVNKVCLVHIPSDAFSVVSCNRLIQCTCT